MLIPTTRKGDNVILNTDYPQEEEFALGDKDFLCYYYFWMFPRKTKLFYERFLRFQGINEKLATKWKEDYKLLIKKALKNTNRTRFLSKNPPNTARIKVLLDMFPNAKFIFIHRNPVEVFLSTRNFFNKMMPYLQLQKLNLKNGKN
ncbi:MAG: sulfotransferase [Bacteroidales bacterium]